MILFKNYNITNLQKSFFILDKNNNYRQLSINREVQFKELLLSYFVLLFCLTYSKNFLYHQRFFTSFC